MEFRKFSLAFILAWLAALPVSAEGWQAIGNVTAIQPLPGGVELRTANAAVRVVAVTDSVVRVRVAPDGTFPGPSRADIGPIPPWLMGSDPQGLTPHRTLLLIYARRWARVRGSASSLPATSPSDRLMRAMSADSWPNCLSTSAMRASRLWVFTTLS